VVEIDHGWCHSIYAEDPNGITVEFCCTTHGVTDEDRRRAQQLLFASAPPLAPTPEPQFYEPTSA
jgi:hypothetical protein